MMNRMAVRVALMMCLPSALLAQVVTDTTKSGKVTHSSLFTPADPFILAAFAAGTIAMFPLDHRIAQELQEPGTQADRATKRAADLFNKIGDPGTILIGVGMYGVGRLAHIDRMADLGLHGTEAIVLSSGVTALLKDLTGRQRPYRAGVDDPDDFSFGRGYRGGFSSFPSGHATAAFAAATVVTLETAHWWPRSKWVIGPVMYTGATVIGLARLYSNAHWASDVLMGAGVGTFTGLKVYRFNHTHAGNRLDRWLLGVPSIAPGAGDQSAGPGVRLVWSFGDVR
ncbi:MAG: phosphatase PAP2 family protein [Gemmatimonadota bacterium]|nr:phosphatase PAP2 family protein [Gemmatimonadota bacterium]